LSEIFDYFNPEPIGVASLAQVHIAHHRESGKTVAVKVSRSGSACFLASTLIIAATTSRFTRVQRDRYEDGWADPRYPSSRSQIAFQTDLARFQVG
jgi:aarF domain-containing kinase